MAKSKRTRNGRRVHHAGERFPLRWEEGPLWGGGAILVLFGVFFAGIPSFIVYQLLTGGEVSSDMGPVGTAIMLFVFIAIGVAAAIGGVAAMLREVEVTLGATGVHGRRKGLLGTRTWQDSLDAYRGVLCEERHHRNKNNSYTEYLITLKHRSEKSRDVLLSREYVGAPQRGHAEAFSRLLNKPILTPVGDDYAERAIEDLDKSIGDLVREGKLQADFDPSREPPGKRLSRSDLLDGYRFERGTRALSTALFLLVFAGIGLGLLYLYFFRPDILAEGEGQVWVVAVVGAAFALFGLIGLAANLFGRMVLDVTDVAVEYRATGRSMRRLLAQDIEEIVVETGSLKLTGDDGTISITTTGFRPDEVNYLRECITAIAVGRIDQPHEEFAAPQPSQQRVSMMPAKAKKVRRFARFAGAAVSIAIVVSFAYPFLKVFAPAQSTRTAKVGAVMNERQMSASVQLATQCATGSDGTIAEARPGEPIAIEAAGTTAVRAGQDLRVQIGRLCAGRIATDEALNMKGFYVEAGLAKQGRWTRAGRTATVTYPATFEAGEQTFVLGPFDVTIPGAGSACPAQPCDVTLRLTLPLLKDGGSHHPFVYRTIAMPAVSDTPNKSAMLSQ
ncbi:MAG: hypothetical protein K0U93_19090 [Gammaproteobacteria bacterium]|nr:hypothetical protein [Gammaproteobacteria bacterium]